MVRTLSTTTSTSATSISSTPFPSSAVTPSLVSSFYEGPISSHDVGTASPSSFPLENGTTNLSCIPPLVQTKNIFKVEEKSLSSTDANSCQQRIGEKKKKTSSSSGEKGEFMMHSQHSSVVSEGSANKSEKQRDDDHDGHKAPSCLKEARVSSPVGSVFGADGFGAAPPPPLVLLGVAEPTVTPVCTGEASVQSSQPSAAVSTLELMEGNKPSFPQGHGTEGLRGLPSTSDRQGDIPGNEGGKGVSPPCMREVGLKVRSDDLVTATSQGVHFSPSSLPYSVSVDSSTNSRSGSLHPQSRIADRLRKDPHCQHHQHPPPQQREKLMEETILGTGTDEVEENLLSSKSGKKSHRKLSAVKMSREKEANAVAAVSSLMSSLDAVPYVSVQINDLKPLPRLVGRPPLPGPPRHHHWILDTQAEQLDQQRRITSTDPSGKEFKKEIEEKMLPWARTTKKENRARKNRKHPQYRKHRSSLSSGTTLSRTFSSENNGSSTRSTTSSSSSSASSSPRYRHRRGEHQRRVRYGGHRILPSSCSSSTSSTASSSAFSSSTSSPPCSPRRSGVITGNALLPGSLMRSFAKRCLHQVEHIAPPPPSTCSPFPFSFPSKERPGADVRKNVNNKNVKASECRGDGMSRRYDSSEVREVLSSFHPPSPFVSSNTKAQGQGVSHHDQHLMNSRHHHYHYGRQSVCTLIVTIHGLSPLPASRAIVHPFVRVWVVDSLTGRNLVQYPSQSLIHFNESKDTFSPDTRVDSVHHDHHSDNSTSATSSSSRSHWNTTNRNPHNNAHKGAYSSCCGVTAPFDLRMRATRSPRWDAELRLPLISSLLTPQNIQQGERSDNQHHNSDNSKHSMKRSKIEEAERVKQEQEAAEAAESMKRAVVLVEVCEAGNESTTGEFIPRCGVERICWGYFMLFSPDSDNNNDDDVSSLQVPSTNINLQLFPNFLYPSSSNFRAPWYVSILQRYLPSLWSPSKAVFALTKAAAHSLWRVKNIGNAQGKESTTYHDDHHSFSNVENQHSFISSGRRMLSEHLSSGRSASRKVATRLDEKVFGDEGNKREVSDGSGSTPLVFFIFQIPESRKVNFRGGLMMSVGYEEEKEEDNILMQWYTTSTELLQRTTRLTREVKKRRLGRWNDLSLCRRISCNYSCSRLPPAPPPSLLVYEAYLLQQLLAAGVALFSPYPQLPMLPSSEEESKWSSEAEMEEARLRQRQQPQHEMEEALDKSIPTMLRQQRWRAFRRNAEERALLPNQLLGTYVVEGSVSCLSLSPGGRFLAVGVTHDFRHDVLVYDPLLPPSAISRSLLPGKGDPLSSTCLPTNAPLLTMRGHKEHIHMICFFPSDDHVLVSGGTDMTVRVWVIEKKEGKKRSGGMGRGRYRPPSPRAWRDVTREEDGLNHTTGTSTTMSTDYRSARSPPPLYGNYDDSGCGRGAGTQEGSRSLLFPSRPSPNLLPNGSSSFFSPMDASHTPSHRGGVEDVDILMRSPHPYSSPIFSDPTNSFQDGMRGEENFYPESTTREDSLCYYYTYRCVYVLPHSFPVYDAVFHEGYLLTCGCSPSMWTWKLTLPTVSSNLMNDSLSSLDSRQERERKGRTKGGKLAAPLPPCPLRAAADYHHDRCDVASQSDGHSGKEGGEEGCPHGFTVGERGSFELVSKVSNEENVVLFSLGNSVGRLHHQHHVWSVSSSGLVTCWRAVEETYGSAHQEHGFGGEKARKKGEESRGCSSNGSTAIPPAHPTHRSNSDSSSISSGTEWHGTDAHHLENTQCEVQLDGSPFRIKANESKMTNFSTRTNGTEKREKQKKKTKNSPRKVWEISARRHVVCSGAVHVSVCGKYVLVTCVREPHWGDGGSGGGGDSQEIWGRSGGMTGDLGSTRGSHGLLGFSSTFSSFSPYQNNDNNSNNNSTYAALRNSSPPSTGIAISLIMFDDATGQMLWRASDIQGILFSSTPSSLPNRPSSFPENSFLPSSSLSLSPSGWFSPLSAPHGELLPGGEALVVGTRDGRLLCWESVDGGLATPGSGFRGWQAPHSIERCSWARHRHLVACASSPFLSSDSSSFMKTWRGEDEEDEEEEDNEGEVWDHLGGRRCHQTTGRKIRREYTAISIGGTSVYSLPSSLRAVLGGAFLPPVRRILSSSTMAVKLFTEACGGVLTERRRLALALSNSKDQQMRRRNISRNRKRRLYEGSTSGRFRVPPLSCGLLDGDASCGAQEDEEDEEDEDDEEDDKDADASEERIKRMKKKGKRKRKKLDPLANEMASIQTSMIQQQQRLHFEEMKTVVGFWKGLTKMHRHHPPTGNGL